MITQVIQWSVSNRPLVLMATLVLVFWGLYSLRETPVDAIPDLSDVQVIVKTSYPGQAPQVVQDQVTYPLTTALMAVPGATTVRGFSFFGDSYVYVLFDDRTDLYWARSRVLEYLSQVSGRLPAGATPELGPDATGVGWIYAYALVDRTGQHDLSELRALQDWFLRFELQAVPGVAEVATVGGMVRQYQIVADPDRLRAHGIPLAQLHAAVVNGNQESGASVVEMAEAEHMVRVTGYIDSLDALKTIPLGRNDRGTPLLLRDVAEVRFGPQMRRGVAELNGEGEVVGGIVVMRFGENASATIARVEQRLQDLRHSLPDGVEIVTTYDRSGLIEDAVNNLKRKLLEEFLVVALVCALFLFHFRSSLVIILSLPVGILAAFVVMQQQGINANIMSLGGIAIAIGAMVDGAIVMVENLHKHMARTPITRDNRWQVVSRAASEVGPPLFFSLMIITLSFMPVFALEAQEGRMFAPLAFTKTYAMAAAAGLAITLVPVLMGYLVRGRVLPEHRNPLNRVLVAGYRPLLQLALKRPWLTVILSGVVLVIGFWPANRLGTEFMPPLDEGDLMYMPTTYAGLSVGKAREILQQTNRLIATVPEVETVFGKAGRADTATDPSPLTMIETFIQLKPRDQWRPGVTPESLRAELNSLVDFPGVSNAWVMPIKTRIDMLSTGIRTPVGIRIAGPDLAEIERLGRGLEALLPKVPGTASVYAERSAAGRYLTVDIDRQQAARYGLNIADIQTVVRTAIGGVNISESVEGQERYPINLRYPQRYRDSPAQLERLPLVTPDKLRITLADVATIRVEQGPPGIKSENARLNGWVLIDIDGRDLGSWVAEAQTLVADEFSLPAGYSLTWTGQYEYLQRAQARLGVLIPLTLAIILVLLYLSFRNVTEVLIILGTLPFALIGGIWLLYLLDYNLSVAVGVGFIALAGLAVEIGVLMLVYLNQALAERRAQAPQALTPVEVEAAVIAGATQRLRPILMTFATVVVGLIPIMLGTGTGSEVMHRIAAPMVGGMTSTLVLTLVVLPVVYFLWRRRAG